MSVLRFPNPGSDISKMIFTYIAIFKELETKRNFTHDDARDAMIKYGLVSSSGAIGQEAVRRSVRDDRSRDSLYNQHKMYSEFYRMLGWYKPGTMNTNFNFTELSSYIAKAEQDYSKRIFEECLLSIVFPNPLVENKKGNIIRPFPFILRLASNLEGVIFRDELIVAVLALQNDTLVDIFEKTVTYIKDLRKNKRKLSAELKKLSQNTGIQTNTLQNYTRIPLGSLKYTGWFNRKTIRGIYSAAMTGFELTKNGQEKTKLLTMLKDIRHEEIENFDINERGSFTLLSSFVFMERCGYDITNFEPIIIDLTQKSNNLLNHLGIRHHSSIFYSPYQQATEEELNFAKELDSKYE
ncbi:hypothetical protein FAM09_03430 [Niastella caeni]|uniref:AlwI family type II restriction endonuclease n=1 Tax=Niastella caeni TaxID=2569763 RepID=A0A4S8HZA3_9BACT|nr:hypothetical protein [Niastella caeni]THU41178.1 hypothetical protein FAM09_03430 [Niastella caeni]